MNMKFSAYNWDDYKIGYGDGEQDRAERYAGIPKYVCYNNEREDDAYFDGYVAATGGMPSKYGTGLPNAHYQDHPFIGKPCKYRFMGNDWRLGITVYGYTNRGDQLIGFAVLDEAQDAVLNLRIEDIQFNLEETGGSR